MENPAPTSSHRMEYRVILLLESVVRLLPRSLAHRLGEGIGLIAFFTGVYRRTVAANMEHCGIGAGKQLVPVMRRLYLNTGRYFVDVLRAPVHLSPYHIENFSVPEKYLRQKCGFMVVLGHFGSWELMGNVFGTMVKDLNVLARPMRNALVQHWLNSKRRVYGVETIDTGSALRKMLRVIERNGVMAILIDQHVGKMGTPAPFMGQQANTARTIGGLIYRTQKPLIAAYALLSKENIYQIHFQEIDVASIPRDNEDEFIAECQKRHNDVLSDWIREYPDHYFGWFHKRFRGQIPY